MYLHICSNSGPAKQTNHDGTLRTGAAGGLVPHLVALLEEQGGEWFFPQRPADAQPWQAPVGNIGLRPVRVPDDLHSAHYETVSIETLLWLFHYLHETACAPAFDARLHSAWDGYREVNALFAKRLGAASSETSGKDVLALVADYHFLLVPGMLSADPACAGTRVVYSHQVPWCEPDYFGILPAPIRHEILTSLLSCHTVVFHCQRWLAAFARCCDRYVPGVTVRGTEIEYRGRIVRLRAVSFPLDAANVLHLLSTEATQRWQRDIARIAAGRQLLVRVDRLDLWKNHSRGLAAFEMLLARCPRLAQDLCFLSVAVPARYQSARHAAYRAAVEAQTAQVNAGSPGRFDPAVLLVPADRSEARNAALAALSQADAVLINPTFDGFNLVAKEASLLGERAEVLLSRNAGAYEYLAPAVTAIEPFDVTATADALDDVLLGSARADQDRLTAVRERVRRDRAAGWLADALGEEMTDFS